MRDAPSSNPPRDSWRRLGRLAVFVGGLGSLALAVSLAFFNGDRGRDMVAFAILVPGFPALVGLTAAAAWKPRAGPGAPAPAGGVPARVLGVFVPALAFTLLALGAAVFVANNVVKSDLGGYGTIVLVGALEAALGAYWVWCFDRAALVAAFADEPAVELESERAGARLGLAEAPVEGHAPRYQLVGSGEPLDAAALGLLESSAHATEVATLWGDELVRVEWLEAGACEIAWPIELAVDGGPRVRVAPVREGGLRAVTLPAPCSATLRKGGRAETLERGARVELEPGDELVIAGPGAVAGYRHAADAEGFAGAPVTLRVRTERAARRAPRGRVVGARAGLPLLAALATEVWFGASVARVVPAPAPESHEITLHHAEVAEDLLARADERWQEANPAETHMTPAPKRWRGPPANDPTTWRMGDVRLPFLPDEIAFTSESWDEIVEAFPSETNKQCAPVPASECGGPREPVGACGTHRRRLAARGLEGIGDPAASALPRPIARVDESDPMLAVRPSPGPRRDEVSEPVNMGPLPQFVTYLPTLNDGRTLRALQRRRREIGRCGSRLSSFWRACAMAYVWPDDQGRLRARISSRDDAGLRVVHDRLACDLSAASAHGLAEVNGFEACVDAAVYGLQVPPETSGGVGIWFDAKPGAK